MWQEREEERERRKKEREENGETVGDDEGGKKPKDDSEKECFNCQKIGHIAKDCPESPKPKKPKVDGEDAEEEEDKPRKEREPEGPRFENPDDAPIQEAEAVETFVKALKDLFKTRRRLPMNVVRDTSSSSLSRALLSSVMFLSVVCSWPLPFVASPTSF